MPKVFIVSLLTPAVCMIASAATLAASVGFSSNTALAFLTDEDRKLQIETALSVLEDANPKTEKKWSNPATGASGSSRSLGNFKSVDGLHCRKLQLFTSGKGIDSRLAFPVCKGRDGEWQIASGKALVKA